MNTKFTALGGPAGALGWPRKAAAVRKGVNGGTAQAFQKGTIYVSTAGTAAVVAPVYSKYGSTGYELGTLGWPTGDAVKSTTAGGATWQAFQRGRVVVAGSKSSVVSGDVLAIWQKRGAEKGSMGWPTADVKTVTAGGKKGLLQTFQTGVATVQGTPRTVTAASARTTSSTRDRRARSAGPPVRRSSRRTTAAAGRSASPAAPCSGAARPGRTRCRRAPRCPSTTPAAAPRARSGG